MPTTYSVTRYPGTITQNTGNTVTTYTGLNNLKNANNTYAKTSKIGGKTETKKNPPSIHCTNFGFNLPEGSQVTSIVVEYAHQKLAVKKDKYPSIGRNTITIVGAGLSSDAYSQTGVAPTKDLQAKTRTWNGENKLETAITVKTPTSIDINTGEVIGYSNVTLTSVKYDLPSISKINSTGFGVYIDYPENTNRYQGYLQLKYIRIKINYKISEYGLSVKYQGSNDITVGTVAYFDITINNLNLTNYSPTVTVQLPEGTEVYSYTDYGEGTKITGNTSTTLTWKIPGGISQTTLNIGLLLTEGANKTIRATELLTDTSNYTTFTVYPTPTGYTEESDEIDESVIYGVQNTNKTITITIPETWKSETSTIYVKTDQYINHNNSNKKSLTIPVSSFSADNTYDLTFKPIYLGVTVMSIAPNNTDTNQAFTIKTIPNNLSSPRVSILTLTEEELDRLGDGYNYDATVYFRLNCDLEDADDFVDYYRNFRLGVVNKELPDNEVTTIFEACTNWSPVMTGFNSWEEKTVKWTYEEDYPVYVIVTGDFTSSDTFLLDFSEISITEEDSTEGYDDGVHIPVPIINCLDSETVSDLTIPAYSTSNKIVLYDLPFPDDFGTNDDYAIRGITLNINLDAISDLVCNATLKGPNGIKGNESILINSNTNNYTIGGTYDLFGLKIGDMTNIKTWEIELSFTNSGSDDIDMIINSVDLSVHFLRLSDNTLETISVDGENLAWYNAFIEDIKIPAGVETNTKYVTVNGTDVNEALLMDLRGKTIEIHLSIDGCNLTETTEMLNQLMKLLTNRRDNLNRPIPKLIEFSFLPNEYFEYIKEDASDADIQISDYELKIKLEIPSGTSYAKNETITGSTGVIDSITKINPIVTVVPNSSNVEIFEEISDQKFNMGYDGWNGKLVVIDCEDRNVYLKEEEDSDAEDISYCADMNNDWFRLDSSFSFKCTGCVLQSVTWTNRS